MRITLLEDKEIKHQKMFNELMWNYRAFFQIKPDFALPIYFKTEMAGNEIAYATNLKKDGLHITCEIDDKTRSLDIIKKYVKYKEVMIITNYCDNGITGNVIKGIVWKQRMFE